MFVNIPGLADTYNVSPSLNPFVLIFLTIPWVTINPSAPAAIFSLTIPTVSADPVSFKLYALLTNGL